MKIVYDGLMFGMLLQLAVGPVCLFVFNEANTRGIDSAGLGVLAVVLVDALYVLLAVSGAAAALKSARVQRWIRYFGFIVLALFGLDMICGSFGMRLLPSIPPSPGGHESFIRGVVITGSNPLTILFWAGVFSLKLADEGFYKKEMLLFGLGAVLATLLFLSAVAVTGAFIAGLLPGSIIDVMNGLIGVAFIVFAVKMVLKKRKEQENCRVV